MSLRPSRSAPRLGVSMESGLEDRNNADSAHAKALSLGVSMESGLEDRNNVQGKGLKWPQIRWSQWSPA